MRHRWVKLKLHNYLCRKCGTASVEQASGTLRQANGDWFTTYHRANGDVIVSAVTPACGERGSLTDERLAWLSKREAVAAAPA